MNIYLVRHGESTSDVKQKYDADYDDHLTQKGREEAEMIAQKLADKGIQKIFSSTRIRAVETAEIMRAVLKCDIIKIEKLNEQNIYGAYPELSTAQPEEEYRRLGELIAKRNADIPGVETYQNLKLRVAESLSEILRSPYQSVAIISHGGPIRSIVRDILKQGELKNMENGAIIQLANIKSHLSIVSLDGVSLYEGTDQNI